jgi:inhibitor of cysteine peptidase
MIEVDDSRNSSEFDVAIGEPIEVRLSENPTTGYRWHLNALDNPALTCEGDVFEPSQQLPGAAGVRRWRFRALQEGVARVELARRRSWERQAVETFTITIRVKAP